MLRELERLGHLERHPDPTDGRAHIIRLTPRGKALDAAVWRAGRDVEGARKSQFDNQTWATFAHVLDALIRASEE
jgi:DNA-binding MarR family transcriptional regulator